MEEKFAVDTNDGYKIYGIKNYTKEKKNSAIFIVHGLGGGMQEYQHKRAADFFQNDYDVYRFNFYSAHKTARKLIDCNLKVHAADLETILDFFAPQYKNIYLIGHSYGATTLMVAQPKHENIRAVSLWDPTFNPARYKDIPENKTLIEHSKYRTLNWGMNILASHELFDEAAKVDDEVCSNLATSFGHPVQVIHAREGLFINDEISFHSFGNPDNVREIIEGAGHCFCEDNTCDELLSRTAKWFRQYP